MCLCYVYIFCQICEVLTEKRGMQRERLKDREKERESERARKMEIHAKDGGKRERDSERESLRELLQWFTHCGLSPTETRRSGGLWQEEEDAEVLYVFNDSSSLSRYVHYIYPQQTQHTYSLSHWAQTSIKHLFHVGSM